MVRAVEAAHPMRVATDWSFPEPVPLFDRTGPRLAPLKRTFVAVGALHNICITRRRHDKVLTCIQTAHRFRSSTP